MADIELVIKISEEDYQFLKEGYSHLKIKEHLIDTRDNRCYIAIANGTPLPKGHGRLIDADALYDQFEYADYDFEKTLEYAPTIIEGDKESEKGQPKQTNDSCLNFDFDKVKEILKKDDFDDLVVDHTCEEKQEQTRDEKMIDAIDFAIKATDSQDDYSMGMRNGMRYVKGLIDGKEPQYEQRRTDKEIKLGIDIGDEVVGEFGTKGVVVGIDTYEDEVLLSLLMRNHKVPQLVKASSWYKTKTNRRFPQIVEVLEQIERQNPVEDIKDNKQCRNCKHCVLIISKVDAEVGYCAKTNKGIQVSLWSYCCDEYEEGDTNDTTQELS